MKKKWGLFPLSFRLGKDERGSILLQFTIYIVVLLGMIGLALDGGRFLLLHNDLQDLADAAAIAGAARLDGTSNALINADYDARNLLTNDPRWSDVAGLKILSGTNGVQFYSTLNPDTVTANPARAKYIKVTTGSWQVAPWFLVAVGAVTNNSASASAVAGVTISACAPMHMMLCNPYEPLNSTGDVSSFNPSLGTMFQLAPGGGNPSAPGNSGFLCPPGMDSCGADDVEVLLSKQDLGSCNLAEMTPRTGNPVGKIKGGINVRFDQQPSNPPTGMDLTPAPIKIDGMSPSGSGMSCSNPGYVYEPNNKNNTGSSAFVNPDAYNCLTGSCPLPRDITSSFTTIGGTKIGTGPAPAKLDIYWQNHHGANWPTVSGTPITRYQAYLQEIAGTWLTDPPAGLEQHGPTCSAPAGNSARRVMNVGVIDCSYWSVRGGAVNNIPYTKYAQLFITEPSDGASVYVEFYQMGTLSNGNLHRIVQLVR